MTETTELVGYNDDGSTYPIVQCKPHTGTKKEHEASKGGHFYRTHSLATRMMKADDIPVGLMIKQSNGRRSMC